MKSLTSGRRVSSAAAGLALAAKTAAASSKALKRGSARTPLGPDEFAMRMQRHQYPEPRQQRDHGGAAIADHRQRHADDRYYAAHHAGIHEYVDEEAQRDGPAGEARKRVLPLHRQVQRATDHHPVEGQDQQLAEQPELLADDREDEVGRTLGQELELRLAAVHVSLAEYAARTDGNLRLNDVIARAQGVGLGVQERQYALALIVVNEMPSSPGGARQKWQRNHDDPKLHAGQQHDDEARGGDQKRRPEIRLEHDHPRRNGDHDAHDHQILDRGRQRPFVHVPGAHHGYREFHDFGGLKAYEADVEPTLCALADVAGHGDHYQQQNADDVGDRREQPQVLRGRKPGEGEQGGHRYGDIRQMMLDHLQILSRCAVNHQDADAYDDRQHPGQRSVQPERAQGATAGGQRAARSRRGEFVKNHGAPVLRWARAS